MTLKLSLRFVVLIGFVSLFADMTYEGARSVAGPYLGTLGASAFLISLVAGLGELAGYALRLPIGRWTDKSGRYWPFAVAGYLINLLSVPALALTHSWQSASCLLISERAGRAVRNPARDAMLAHATNEIGRGWGFGLHEALDQTGALVGPLLIALFLAYRPDYRVGFALLLVPAGIALSLLFAAFRQFPHPREVEMDLIRAEAQPNPARFWWYAVGAGMIGAGYADFPLIAYHFAQNGEFARSAIALAYALAMGVSALSALAFGKLFDLAGIRSSVFGLLAAAGFAPLVFWGHAPAALAGMGLWGVGLGVQESALRAGLARLVPKERRATAYGTFDTVFGIFWAAGSAIMGLLYGSSLAALVIFSVVAQVIAIPMLLRATRLNR